MNNKVGNSHKDADQEPQVALPEGEYADYLAEKAANIADSKAKKRDTTWRGILSLVITGFAILGITNISGLRKDIRTLVVADVQPTITSEVEEYFEKNGTDLVSRELTKITNLLHSKTALISFSILAQNMSEKSGFTPGERDSAIDLLNELKIDKSLIESNQFKVALESLIDSFAAAGLNNYIDDIELSLGMVAANTRGISITLVQHYGQRQLGGLTPSPKTTKSFEKYLEASRRHGDEGVFIAYSMMYQFQKGQQITNPVITGYWDNLSFSTSEEKEKFRRLFSGWKRQLESPKTGEQKRLSELADKFQEAHTNQFQNVSLLGEEDDEEQQLRELFELLRGNAEKS